MNSEPFAGPSSGVEKHLSTISKSLYVIAEMKFKDRNTLLRDRKDYFVKDMEEILDEIRKELTEPKE